MYLQDQDVSDSVLLRCILLVNLISASLLAHNLVWVNGVYITHTHRKWPYRSRYSISASSLRIDVPPCATFKSLEIFFAKTVKLYFLDIYRKEIQIPTWDILISGRCIFGQILKWTKICQIPTSQALAAFPERLENFISNWCIQNTRMFHKHMDLEAIVDAEYLWVLPCYF